MKTLFALLTALLLSTPAFAQDHVQARFVGSGFEAGGFPITTSITRVVLRTSGVDVTFDRKPGEANPWPWTCGRPQIEPADDCKEAGGAIDMGPLRYSVGLVLQVNGEWVASAPIEKYDATPAGGQIQNQSVTCPSGTGQIHCNWFYDRRWAPLDSVTPPAGAQVGVYVVAGDARNNFYVVRERSNIVLVTLPQTGQEAAFDFAPSAPPPSPVPPPPPVTLPPPPVVVPPPPVVPTVDLSDIRAQLAQLVQLDTDTHAMVQEIRDTTRTFKQQLGTVMSFVGKYVAPALVSFLAGKKLL